MELVRAVVAAAFASSRSIVWILLALRAAPPLVAGEVCGDGVIAGPEQCDDGIPLDLDGCTRDCRYETVQRVTSLALQGGNAPPSCVPVTNRLGDAFTVLGLAAFNNTLGGAVNGQDAMLLDILDLALPDGSDDPTLEVGLFGGTADPDDPSPGGFDSWFLVGEEQLDANGFPSQRLGQGTLASLELLAGPGDVSFPLLGGSLTLLGARLAAEVSGTAGVPAPPPDELAPGVVAFDSLDADGADLGLCGNLTVGSLALIPVPTEITVGGQACRANCAGSRAYVACGGGPVTASCHSLLDVLVGGCKVDDTCFITAIHPTQPDVGVGANPPTTLVFQPSGGGIDKVVVVEPNDAYSAWFTLLAERSHITDNLSAIFVDGYESGDLTAWSSTVPRAPLRP